jgi:glutathione synthase/RimK-type ligase-like ATP-grasp enzyme
MTILVLAVSSDLAADLIVIELRRRAVPYQRINVNDFPFGLEITYDPRSSSAIFTSGNRRLYSGDVSAAWCRRSWRSTHPDPYVRRETDFFLNGLWREMTWLWVNDPAAVDRANNKLWQLSVAAKIGFDTPLTLFSNQAKEVSDKFSPGPLVAKTIGGAAIERDGIREHLFSQCISLEELDSAAVKAAPCIFQEQAKPGIDVRVTVAGEHVFATDIAAPPGYLDWRAAPWETVSYHPVDLPAEVKKCCLEMCRIAGLTYGAFDLVRQPSGRHVFLEVNASGQWGWIEQATGQRITEAIVDCLVSYQRGQDDGERETT